MQNFAWYIMLFWNPPSPRGWEIWCAESPGGPGVGYFWFWNPQGPPGWGICVLVPPMQTLILPCPSHGITIKTSLLDNESKVCVCNWVFLLTNQKLAFLPQPIKCYFANPISKKEIGGAWTRTFLSLCDCLLKSKGYVSTLTEHFKNLLSQAKHSWRFLTVSETY